MPIKRDGQVEGLAVLLFQSGFRQIEPCLEDRLGQRLCSRRLGLLVAFLEPLEVAPVVEDLEMGLVLARAEQVRAESRPATDHLPELHIGIDRLGENKIDDFRHVDARVEHIHRNCDGQIRVVAYALEVVDQGFRPWVVADDRLAEVAAILRVHLVEEFFQQPGVLDTAGENDGLPNAAASATRMPLSIRFRRMWRLVSLL